MSHVEDRDPTRWTLLTSAWDLVLVVSAFSMDMPAVAEILTSPLKDGEASFVLKTCYFSGITHLNQLDRSLRQAESAVAAAKSIIVVEEDALARYGRRFTYVATIINLPTPTPKTPPRGGR